MEPGHDLVIVVGRILLIARVPLHLCAVYRLAVNHRAELPVAGAEIEADAAALQVAAQRDGALLGRRGLVGVGDLHLKRLLVHLRPELVVEGPQPLGGVGLLDELTDAAGAAEVDLVPASLEPRAMPRMAFTPRDMEPASAVTSPSLITSNGTPHSLAMRGYSPPTLSSKISFGTARKREAMRARLLMTIPAALPPIASTLGKRAAARWSPDMIS